MTSVLPVYTRAPLKTLKGEGCYLYDIKGQKYLDLTGGIAVLSLGHCPPAIVDVLKNQAEKLWHTSNLFEIPEQESFAKLLTENSFADKVFFTNSGTESVEAGLKFVRKYFNSQKLFHKNKVLTFDGGFHGRSIAAISAAGKEKLVDGFEPLLEKFEQVPLNDIEALERSFTADTAAVLFEPIMGEGGIIEPDALFLQKVKELCEKHHSLFFVDEIQSGIGRTGKLFASDWLGIKPDIMAVAKGIGSGFPLGACLLSDEVASHINPGSHGSTYGGNPLAMAVGQAVVEKITQPDFLTHVQTVGDYFVDRLAELMKTFPSLIKEVRGRGLMLGVECYYPITDIIPLLRDSGLLVAPASHNVLRLLPPLILTNQQVDEALDILFNVFESLQDLKKTAEI